MVQWSPFPIWCYLTVHKFCCEAQVTRTTRLLHRIVSLFEALCFSRTPVLVGRRMNAYSSFSNHKKIFILVCVTWSQSFQRISVSDTEPENRRGHTPHMHTPLGFTSASGSCPPPPLVPLLRNKDQYSFYITLQKTDKKKQTRGLAEM